jgi:hypothetical protein
MNSTALKLTILLVIGIFALPRSPRAIPAEVAASVSADAALAGDSVIVDWFTLGDLNHETGAVGSELTPFVGREVMIPGFIVPLEDFAEEASEFLLVPYVGACVHTPAPPPNQLVHVKMKGGRKVSVPLWAPVWLHGELRVEASESIYGPAGFFVPGDSVTPYEDW